jgi:N-acetylglucosamine kinase-like BadF-type ATPase
LGIAGAGKIKNKSNILSAINNTYQTHSDLVSDAHIALYAIIKKEGQAAMLILSGTGSTIMITDDKQTHMVGGFGHLLGDEGSAYHVVIQALKNTISHYEMGLHLSTFEKKLLTEINATDIQEIKTFVYDHQKIDIANIAKFISNAATEGYQEAIDLLVNEGFLLGKQSVNAYKLLNTKPEVVIDFKGGFIEKAPYVKDACLNYLKQHIPSFVISQHKTDPVLGAFHLALSHLRGKDL